MGVKIVQNVDQDRSTPTENPTQQVPDESTSSSLNPEPSETTSNYSWNAFIDKAITISAEQIRVARLTITDLTGPFKTLRVTHEELPASIA